MTLEADVVLVDEVEAAQIAQSVGPAETVRESWRIAVAVAGLIERQHDVAPTGEFDREVALSLARIEVAMDGEHAGRRCFRRGIRGNEQQRTHGGAARSDESHVQDADTACGLNEICKESAGKHDQRRQ